MTDTLLLFSSSLNVRSCSGSVNPYSQMTGTLLLFSGSLNVRSYLGAVNPHSQMTGTLPRCSSSLKVRRCPRPTNTYVDSDNWTLLFGRDSRSAIATVLFGSP